PARGSGRGGIHWLPGEGEGHRADSYGRLLLDAASGEASAPECPARCLTRPSVGGDVPTLRVHHRTPAEAHGEAPDEPRPILFGYDSGPEAAALRAGDPHPRCH